MSSVIGLNPDRSLYFIKEGRKQRILGQNNPCPTSNQDSTVTDKFSSFCLNLVSDPSTPPNRAITYFSTQDFSNWRDNILILPFLSAKTTGYNKAKWTARLRGSEAQNFPKWNWGEGSSQHMLFPLSFFTVYWYNRLFAEVGYNTKIRHFSCVVGANPNRGLVGLFWRVFSFLSVGFYFFLAYSFDGILFKNFIFIAVVHYSIKSWWY